MSMVASGAGQSMQQAPNVQGLYNNAIASLQGTDLGQLQQLNQQYAQNQGNTANQAISAGIGNTSVLNSLQANNQNQYNLAQTNIQDQYQQMLAGLQAQQAQAGLEQYGINQQYQAQTLPANLQYQEFLANKPRVTQNGAL
jgi:hypothetical protein